MPAPSALFRLFVGIALAASLAAVAFDLDRLRAAYLRAGSNPPEERFASWAGLVDAARRRPTQEQLTRVNDFFNQRVRFVDDTDQWGQADYWATPMETLAHAAGDCEDFAIAKYFTLLALGVPVEKLRLTYVRAKVAAAGAAAYQAHMVLAYYASPDAEPLVLDNLVPGIQPASRRTDLLPVFNFNSERIYQMGAGKTATTGVSQLSRWADALRRARADGFD